ncbi:hypothetical protein JKA73_10355 [Myxococcus xanthus]|uniref:hypothetical protein n=1 Tax=Myxococcus xanthus TaxID=34 RepID=UPI00191783E9|nr:hypothetical protein [Myxococcus xanthus]QQR46441.1 hypothetical protein JKA73_10355 [Myxococcus xanthus]
MRVLSSLAAIPRVLAMMFCLFGAQALASYATVLDGTVLLSADNTSRYLVAGGARFFIPSTQWSLYSSANLVVMSQSSIDAITQIPRDGTLAREKGQIAIYVFVGGMPWWIPNPTELDFWDDWKTINEIPSYWEAPFQDYSIQQVLLRERTGTQIYIWTTGLKIPITNASDLAYYGGESNVKTVPLGTLANHSDSEPYCGAILRERSSSTSYYLGYSAGLMRRYATTSAPHAVVPDGALSSFPVTTSGPYCIQ